MSASFFYVMVFSIIWITIYVVFRRIFPAMIFALFTLIFFGDLLPPSILGYAQLTVVLGMAYLIYKAVSSKYTS
jgi:hypothetical protein